MKAKALRRNRERLNEDQDAEVVVTADCNFIEEKPTFDELHKLANAAEEVTSSIATLADEPDIAQRATDLLVTCENLLEQVREMVLVPNEIDDGD